MLDSSGKAWLQNQARLVGLPHFVDDRGTLVAIDYASLPFPVRRMFIVNDVPEGSVRGQHAHRTARQLLVRLAGRIDVEMRAGDDIARVTLDRSDHGLLLEPRVWASQTYSSKAVLLVLSDESYDAGSYLTPETA